MSNVGEQAPSAKLLISPQAGRCPARQRGAPRSAINGSQGLRRVASLVACPGMTKGGVEELDLFAEQDPRVLGRDDERLARDPWRLFAADNSKAGCDCSQSRLGRWRRPVSQQHISRIGDRQNNPVTIDPTGLNDNWLSEMLAAADLVGHPQKSIAAGRRGSDNVRKGCERP